IAFEPRALQLLSRAADGSLRDALSLTDQAIASGDGRLTAESVSAMLGTLDDDQALSLIEALVAADGERVMAGVNEAAARGVEWEALLVEMQSLLHRIAMVQLSPSALGTDMAAIELRMRELARTVPPTDVQLYYQTLLIGRKELPYAPDRRMGVEMTLLRALAFHPRMPLPEPEAPPVQAIQAAPVQQAVPESAPPPNLPQTTSQVLAARSQLQRSQGAPTPKKSEPAAASRARPVNNAALERLSSITERVQARPAAAALEKAPAKKEAYRWKSTTVVETVKEEVATPKALKKALEHEKTPELAAKLAVEAVERDSWAAEVSRLAVPKLVEQVALNAWKEQEGHRVCLHLRPSQRHLNSAGAQQKLAEALGILYGTPVELTIVEDDNPAMRTPLEWRQAIYEEKLAQAREAIIADNNIQTLRRFFDADLDEESIRPI
ncbi:DNA polymerase III subunit gamma/tau, partial [Klebsiella michiganensis]